MSLHCLLTFSINKYCIVIGWRVQDSCYDFMFFFSVILGDMAHSIVEFVWHLELVIYLVFCSLSFFCHTQLFWVCMF